MSQAEIAMGRNHPRTATEQRGKGGRTMTTGMAARVTALFMAGVVAATVLGAGAATFPIDGDGAYTVNVVRQSMLGDPATPPVSVIDGAGVSSGGYQPRYAVDGAGEKLQWDAQVAGDPARTASVQITLDGVYTLKKFNHSYLVLPAGYQIDVSTTGFGSMTTVVNSPTTAPSANQVDTLATPADAKYIQYTWLGTGGSRYVMLQEFRAYADQTTALPPVTADGLDVIALGASGPVTAQKLNANWQTDPASNIIDLNQFSYLRGNGVGDAVVEVDLGATYKLGGFSLGFYQGQTWGAGARIDLSEDGIGYTTVFDQTSSLISSQDIPIAWTAGRYIKITNYGGATGALSDLQVFAVPEPAALMVLALGGGLALLRRRRNATANASAVLALFLALTCIGFFCDQTSAASYTDPTLVNLFRQTDTAGNNIVQTQWANITPGGSISSPAYNGVDAGHWSTQLNWNSQSSTNAAAYQVTLPQAVHVGTLKHTYGGHYAEQYRILGSTTGFGSLNELKTWTPVPNNGPYTDTVNAMVQYIQYEFLGTAISQYLLLSEVEALPAPSDSVSMGAGYNLFAERSTAGPIPNNATFQGGSWIDDPNVTVDLNENSFLRGNALGGDNWFIVPLNDTYYLTGAGVGFYHGQAWTGGVSIDVTDAAVVDGSTTWTNVFTQSTSLASQMIPFAGEFPATFVRVSTPATGSGGAMCEFELFTIEIPEPGTALVLVIGLLASLRQGARRK